MKGLRGKILYLASALTIGVILFWWFRIFLSRYFDADELAHLHWAYLQFKGQRPYVDFFYIFPPFFNFLFYPLFFILGESVSVLVLARVVNFLVYILTAGATFLLAREVFDPPSSSGTSAGKAAELLTVVVFLSLPMGLAKQLEIRPDNLSVAFFVLGLWAFFRGFFNKKNKWFFWSGLFLGVNTAIVQKGALNAGLALIVMFLLVIFLKRKEFLKITARILQGLILPFLILATYLLLRGILFEGLEAMVILSPLTNVGIAFAPFWWFFLPNDVYYGGFNNFPWIFNRGLFFLAGMGVVFLALEFFKKRKFDQEVVGGLSLGLMIVFLIFLLGRLGATFLQYYLPIFPLVSILAAVGLLQGLRFLRLKKWWGLIAIISFFGVCLYSSYEAYKGRRDWSNDYNLEYVADYLEVSKTEDRVFDFWGFYIFRLDGYFVCCENFPYFDRRLQARLPNFLKEIKEKETRFITLPRTGGGMVGGRMASLSFKDLDFLKENYLLTGVGDIRAVGKTFYLLKNEKKRSEIFVAGNYRVLGREMMIDEKKYKPGEVLFLVKDAHEFGATEEGRVWLRYDWEGRRYN